jgi:hypothetical protein
MLENTPFSVLTSVALMLLKEKLAVKPSLVTLTHCCAELALPKSMRWALTVEPMSNPIRRNAAVKMLAFLISLNY